MRPEHGLYAVGPRCHRHSALVQHDETVCDMKKGGMAIYDHHSAAPLLYSNNRLDQLGLPRGVEVSSWSIQDNESGPSVEGSSQANTMLLSRGESDPAAEMGLVARGQALNHAMSARE